MAGRPSLPRGTFGNISTRKLDSGTVRASARLRDWSGQLHQVTATARSAASARSGLEQRIATLVRLSQVSLQLSPASSLGDLADAWLVELNADMAVPESFRAKYARILRVAILPNIGALAVRDVTVPCVEHLLTSQPPASSERASAFAAVFSMVMEFGVSIGVVASNPMTDVSWPSESRSPRPGEIEVVRATARVWRTEEGVPGPRPRREVRDLIDVLLGSSMTVGEALALRDCDVGEDDESLTVRVAGTILVRKGVGVVRQPYTQNDPKARRETLLGFAFGALVRRVEEGGRDDLERLLFVTRDGKPIAPQNIRRTIRGILQSSGLEHLDLGGRRAGRKVERAGTKTNPRR